MRAADFRVQSCRSDGRSCVPLAAQQLRGATGIYGCDTRLSIQPDFGVYPVDLDGFPFHIEDASGHAILVPDGADVIRARSDVNYADVNYAGARNIVHETIIEDDRPYVACHFRTVRDDVDIAAESERLVNERKHDETRIEQFDPARNNFISAPRCAQCMGPRYAWGHSMHGATMKAARLKAISEETVRRIHTAARSTDGRKSVIASLQPEKLAGYATQYLIIGLTLCLCAAAGAVVPCRARLATTQEDTP